MAKKKFNKYIGALLMGGAIMAVPSCSDYDDHFLPEEKGGEGSSATETLWDIIKADENLSMFATILENTKYYKDDTHPVESYTYADVLKSGQVSTVWAPENSSLERDFSTWLDLCETDGYTVEQQLIRNHIALWRHNVSGTGVDTVKMLNAKNMIFDRGKETFDGIAINKKNIPAMNGVLHTIGKTTTFEYNFYEYIKYAGMTPSFSDFIIKFDTTYFNIGASIEGLPDENGNPTYVDSVYSTYNRLVNSAAWLPNINADKCMNVVKGFGWNSNIMAEDSMFVMIIPTDQAMQEAYEKLKPYYTYAPSYEDKVKGNDAPTTKVTMKDYDPDSLTELNIKMDIASPLVFNIHKQPKIGGYTSGTPWTLERFLEDKGDAAEYLLNTYGDTIRNITAGQLTPWLSTWEQASNEPTDPNKVVWNKTSLFNGEVLKMSNGYAYLADKWAFPMEYYKPPVVVEVSGAALYGTSNTSTYYKGLCETRSFSNSAFAEIAEQYGKVSRNNFFLAKQNGTTAPHFEVRLKGNVRDQYMPTSSDVMSGTYDIYLVLVPYWYRDISEAGTIDTLFLDPEYVASYASTRQSRLRVQVRYNDGKASDATSAWFPNYFKCSVCGHIYYEATKAPASCVECGTVNTDSKIITKDSKLTYESLKVDTVKVIDSFKFPYSYKNLTYSYPTLIIESNPSNTELRNGFIRDFCIDQIILRSKEDNREDYVIGL